MKKLLFTFIILIFSGSVLFAQTKKSSTPAKKSTIVKFDPNLLGVWEYKYQKNSLGDSIPAHTIGHMKIYNSNNEYMIITPTRNGYVVMLEGVYKVTGPGKLVENTKSKSLNMMENPLEADISYKLSEDKSILTVYLNLKNELNQEHKAMEVWKKVKPLGL